MKGQAAHPLSPTSYFFMPPLLIGFLLVLARVGGVLALAPLPGARLFPTPAKLALAVLLAAALAPLAGVRIPTPGGLGTLTVWIMGEAGFGLAVGLSLHLLSEMLGMAAQLIGFQAGYSYINTIDPATQVDATILNVLLAMMGGLLFFAFDMQLHVVRALAMSLEATPLGEFVVEPATAWRLVKLGAAVFETAFRLAFPVVAVLLLLDLSLALLSYVNSRMQLLTLAFPIKMVVTIFGLTLILGAVPRLYQSLARQSLAVIYQLAGR